MTTLHSTANAQATFCATLVDEWVRCGVRNAFIAPGSRSTPLALALAMRSELRVEVFIDERSAAFAGLGCSLVSGLPAVVLCTSGTAATHFHAAIVEAHLSAVPLIVCTADRPSELRDVGAAQTIDQTKLFGNSVRWFHDPGVASYEAAHTWRALANQVVARALTPVPGPVHMNLPFREPLVGDVVDMPPTREHDGPWSGHMAAKARLTDWEIDDLALRLVGRRGVIIAGDCGGGYDIGAYAAAATVLASVLDWPLFADPRSGARVEGGNIVAHFDGIVRSQAASSQLQPDIVLRLGAPPASKVLGQWVSATGAEQVVVHSFGTYHDPDHAVSQHIEADIINTVDRLCNAASRIVSDDTIAASLPVHWSVLWREAEAQAVTAIREVLAQETELNEPEVARAIAREFRTAMVSSSMPIRDIEWFAETGEGVLVYANRGANGIDGVIASGVGVSCVLGKTAIYLGDVAFIHDSSSLAGLVQRGLDVRIVVTDNNGGGIFSFLPQASSVAPPTFEKLFGTPHGADVAGVARAYGLSVYEPVSVDELADALAQPGPSLTVVKTRRTSNVALHAKLHEAIVSHVDK